MDLPKIKNEDLPEELKELLGDEDAEFEAIVDPMDIIDIQLDPDAYYEGRLHILTVSSNCSVTFVSINSYKYSL